MKLIEMNYKEFTKFKFEKFSAMNKLEVDFCGLILLQEFITIELPKFIEKYKKGAKEPPKSDIELSCYIGGELLIFLESTLNNKYVTTKSLKLGCEFIFNQRESYYSYMKFDELAK